MYCNNTRPDRWKKKIYINEDRKKIKGQSTNKARREAAPAPLQEWGGVSSGKKKISSGQGRAKKSL